MATPTLPTKILPFPADRPLAPELPSDIEAEKSVLGSILLNREAILTIRDWLPPERFYLQRHAQIYQAMLDMVAAGTPPDTRTVAGELKIRGQLETVGGLLYLTEVVESVPTSYHIEHYAQLVDRAGWLREAVYTGGRIAALGYSSDAEKAALEIEMLFSKLMSARRHRAVRVFDITELWDKQYPPLQVLVEGLLYEGLTLFSGKPKMGKSLLTLNLAAAVASGGEALGAATVTQGDVLYLCLEDPEAVLQERLAQILTERAAIPFSYQTAWPTLDAGGISAIAAWLTEHPQARLIVIDTLASVAPAPDARKTTYQADYDSLRHLQRLAAARPGLAIVVNTHSRKAGADDVLDEVSGTTGKTGGADHIWVMRRVRGENEAELHVQPRRAASAVRALTFDPQLVTWRLGGDAAASKAARLRTDMLEALADGSYWPKDLAEYLGADRAQVRRQLGTMKKQALVDEERDGKYRLTDTGRRSIDLRSGDEAKDRSGSGIRDQTTQRGFRGVEGFDPPTEGGLIPDPRSTAIFDPTPEDQTPLEIELDRILTPIPPRERFYARMYLRSLKASDHALAQRKCETHGADYAAAYRLIHGSDPPEGD